MTGRYDHIEKQTHDIYIENARAFDEQRYKGLFERSWLDRFATHLPTGGSVLDVGCGAAEPIAAYFIAQGFDVTGVDFSRPMLELAQSRFPDNEWVHGDMRSLNLERTFDGLIAWNSFFHLKQDDQRAVLTVFADHLSPGGTLMVTVGPEDGEVIGHVNGKEVYHASLAPEEYTSTLNHLGLDIVEFVLEDESCDFHTVLLAKKRG